MQLCARLKFYLKFYALISGVFWRDKIFGGKYAILGMILVNC